MNKINDSRGDRILYTIADILLIFVLIIVAYPVIYVISSSFSSGAAVSSGRVVLWPVDFSLQGYQLVFVNKTVWIGMKNSIIYTIAGTVINMFLSIMAAYPLSRPQYRFKGLLGTMFTITMIFSAGIIPTYIIMSRMNLVNSVVGYLLLNAVTTYNMVIIKTYFKNSIPADLFDAAAIDGCSEFQILSKVVLPLSKSVLSVVTLYYAVAHWNAYFNALIYLPKEEMQPLQCVLRRILDSSKVNLADIENAEDMVDMLGAADLLKYSLIVIATVPILVVYPFVQKFFKKGVMIGSVKG